jgi:uncharacterized protein YacL (UPF0231 family)
VDKKEFQGIKARSAEVKRLMEPYMQNWFEKDVQKLFAEVEKLRAEQETLRRNIQILKHEFSTRISKEEVRVRGIKASRAEMRKVLEYIRGKLGSLNIGESLHKIDLVLPTSAPSHPQTKRRTIPMFIEHT